MARTNRNIGLPGLTVSPLRPGTFWRISGLRSDESVEFLESIAS
jgi:hypothetical protein